MSTTRSAVVASDYASVEAAGVDLYYGYEVTDADGNWCFRLQAPGRGPVVIPFPELGAREEFDVEECFVEGVARLLERGILTVAATPTPESAE